MKSYSILSPNDGKLLIRMHDELVKGGMKSWVWWNRSSNPYELNELAAIEGRKVYFYCLYTGNKNGITFHCHDCAFYNIQNNELINLTPENFDEVLKKVIENS